VNSCLLVFGFAGRGSEARHRKQRQDRKVPVVFMDNHIRSVRGQPNVIPMRHRIFLAVSHAQRKRRPARYRGLNLLPVHANKLPNSRQTASAVWPERRWLTTKVSDRRPQERWSARGALELPPSGARKSGAAVRSTDFILRFNGDYGHHSPKKQSAPAQGRTKSHPPQRR
jgi:hypothetical protein